MEGRGRSLSRRVRCDRGPTSLWSLGTGRIIIRYGQRSHRRPGRSRAQSQGHRRRDPPRPAGRDHRAVGVGQVLARVRHDLRRGAAPLRRVAVGVRAPVPRADGEARGRLDRGPVARHLDRAEDDLEEPALDRRHRHRDLRLPARALRAGRRAALPEVRPRHLRPDRAADGRSRADAAGRHPPARAGPGHPRPQGRVQEALPRLPAAGLLPRPCQRHHPRARRGHRPRQEPQAHHRGRHRPSHRPRQPRPPPRRLPGDRPPPRRRHRASRTHHIRRRRRPR